MIRSTVLALSLLLPIVGAHAQDPRPAATTPWAGYHLAAEDQIQVDIYGPSPTTVKTRIKTNGTITLPLVGNVTASGQTVESLADVIQTKLKANKLLNDPIVNVEVVAYASQTVTLLGEVGTPGIFPLDRPQTLGEMISRVGGLKPGASDRLTLRHGDSNRGEIYSLSEIARGAQRDVALRAGDVIFAGPAEQFYIYGQVGSAGVYAILPGMTVRQALARAGGPTLAGSEKKVTLYRGGKESDADLNGLLRAEDVLFIRERTF